MKLLQIPQSLGGLLASMGIFPDISNKTKNILKINQVYELLTWHPVPSLHGK